MPLRLPRRRRRTATPIGRTTPERPAHKGDLIESFANMPGSQAPPTGRALAAHLREQPQEALPDGPPGVTGS